MVRHDDKREVKDFFKRTLMALFLLAVLKKSGYFISSKDGKNPFRVECNKT